jgi:hypothetical protein
MIEVKEMPPEVMTPQFIVYWSTSARQLEGITQGKAIITKAKKLVELNLVEYDKEHKCFKVNPIPGYNKTTYTVNGRGDGHFECDCQFYNTVSNKWEHPSCSHIQAVKFWLEINRWNKINMEEKQ